MTGSSADNPWDELFLRGQRLYPTVDELVELSDFERRAVAEFGSWPRAFEEQRKRADDERRKAMQERLERLQEWRKQSDILAAKANPAVDLTKGQPRPSWDDHFFNMARTVSEMATCPRASIGAVLIKHKRVIASGFNGVDEGKPHCPNTTEHLTLEHCPDAKHAEYNALRNALVPAFGSTIYVYGPRRVCVGCAALLKQQGVTDVRWREL